MFGRGKPSGRADVAGLRRTSAFVRRLLAHERTGRIHVVLVLSAAVGALTGLAMAGFDQAVREGSFKWVLRQPLAVAAILPALGLAIATVIVRRFARGDASTTDAYVLSYHRRGGQMRLRDLPAKFIACAATLGSGAALGFEGPAMLVGGTFGSVAERRFTRRWPQDDAKVLMVAGAAAGVSAVFKAPLTGIVFALEVPYTQDLARRALLPALVASSASYLTFVALLGTTPVLSTGGVAPFDLRDLIGGLALGVLCGLLARAGAWGILRAKHLELPPWARLVVAGGSLAVLAVVSHHFYRSALTLGSGYDAILWTRSHEHAVALLAVLFVLRYAATWMSIAGGGVGGLFIPLVTQGAILGGVLQSMIHAKNGGLLPTVGIAAFLGAGYRTPLAGVAFVAEATGQAGFVVPALLAAAAAQLTIGRWSFSAYQRRQRAVAITPASELHLHDVMSSNPDTIDADLPLDRAAQLMMTSNRRWAPVVEDQRYIGLIALSDIAKVPVADWAVRSARDLVHAVESADVHDTVADAARRIRAGGIGALAVTDNGAVVGVVTVRDVSNVERLLERLSPEGEDSGNGHS